MNSKHIVMAVAAAFCTVAISQIALAEIKTQETGADDPMIGLEQVESFRKEMSAAGAQFSIISYPGARDSFTNPDADKSEFQASAIAPAQIRNPS